MLENRYEFYSVILSINQIISPKMTCLSAFAVAEQGCWVCRIWSGPFFGQSERKQLFANSIESPDLLFNPGFAGQPTVLA